MSKLIDRLLRTGTVFEWDVSLRKKWSHARKTPDRSSSSRPAPPRPTPPRLMSSVFFRKQLFRLIVEETPDMMSIHGLDHRAPFRYASSAFQRVAGINPRDVLGRGLTDLIAEEDCAAVQEALLKVS